MGTEILLVILFTSLLLGIFAGFPVAFVMLGSGLIVGLLGGGSSFFHTLLLRTYGVMESYELVAIPLFIFMGVMLQKSGAAERLFSAFHVSLGGLKGGLAITTVAICTIMAAATGIVGASVVSMGLFALPAMLKRGYNTSLSTGSICAGGTLGILIPPSLMLVVYGPMAGISVGRLFMGAVIPGLILSVLYMLYISIQCYIKPDLAPPLPKSERDKISHRKKIMLILTSLLPTLFVILAVMGSIFFGIAAPTEASALGAFAAMLLAILYRQLGWTTLKESVFSSLKVTAMIMWTVIGAFTFTGAFMVVGGGQLVREALLALPFGPTVMLLVMAFAFLILGFFMEWIGIVPILVPIFTPVILSIGLDPLWAAIIFCMIMQTSFLTPPMAPTLFYLKGVCPPEVKFEHLVRGILPFLVLQIIGVMLVIVLPQIATWLPKLMIR